MPANRFDTSANQEYVSQYVPMPFETMYKIGTDMQTKYDKSLKDLEVTDPIAKLNPRAAIKVYDPNSPEGVSDAPLDWTGQKNEYLNILNAEKNKITDDYMQTGDAETFKKKSRDYINKAAQVYSDLSSKEAVAKQVTDFNKELAKNKDFSVQGHLGQKLLDYNTQFFKDAAEGKVREYSPFDIASPTDRPKEVKEYFGSMGKEIATSLASPTGTGYIRTKYREGLSGDKISDVFNSWYQNSKVQDDIRLEALDVAARKGIDTKAEVTVKVPVSKNAKTGEITYKEEKMPWIDAYEERALNQVKDMALGFKSSTGKDALTGDASYWKGLERQDEEAAANLLTTNEQGNAEVLNLGSVLKGLGLDDVMTTSGDWLTKQTADVKGTNAGVSGGFNMLNAPILGGIIKAALPSKSAEQLVNEGYKKIIEKHKELGLPEPVDQTGKPTGKYKEQLYNYAVELAKRRSTTSNLQQSTIQGMNKAMLGPNSNIHNMEFYLQGDESSNAKITNEEVKNMPKNASYTGIDFFGPKQAGWKLAVSNKNDDGTTVDQAYLAVPRDKTFEEDTRAVHNISRGVLDFAKTGKINSQYFDPQSGKMLQNMIDANKDKFIGTNIPKLVASSVERNRFGEVVVMGSYVDNSTGTPQFKAITYYPNRSTDNLKATSLDEVQANKTTEIQAKGSLKQYNTSFKETTKPSEISIDDNSNEDN